MILAIKGESHNEEEKGKERKGRGPPRAKTPPPPEATQSPDPYSVGHVIRSRDAKPSDNPVTSGAAVGRPAPNSATPDVTSPGRVTIWNRDSRIARCYLLPDGKGVIVAVHAKLLEP